MSVLRSQIDAIDHRLAALLHDRARIVGDIQRTRMVKGKAYDRDFSRETEILQRISAGELGGYPPDVLRSIWRVLFGAHLSMLEVDQTSPGDRWSFDGGVTSVFSDMLRRSIPQYEEMRDLVAWYAGQYLARGRIVWDLGCSRGDGIARLKAVADRAGMVCQFVGVDSSAPMVEWATRMFIADPLVTILNLDLRRDWPSGHCSVALLVLTLQFIPVNHRPRILRRLHLSMFGDGAAIIVEKVQGEGDVDDLMVDRYHQLKAENGYSEQEISAKARSLDGVLVPLTARQNELMFREAGFRQVDCFWRWNNFAAWIALP